MYMKIFTLQIICYICPVTLKRITMSKEEIQQMILNINSLSVDAEKQAKEESDKYVKGLYDGQVTAFETVIKLLLIHERKA